MRVVVDRPSDHQVWDRAELVAGWIEGAPHLGDVRVTCGGETLPVAFCMHPRGLGRDDVHGFWTEVVVQRHLAAIRDGMLRLEVWHDGVRLGSLPLWVMPAARELAASHPLDLAGYPVAPAPPAAARPAPPTIVFPGLGAVGGSSLNRLVRTKMLHERWATTIYDEANAPALWASMRARHPRVVHRWIDGHACYDAVPIGGGDAVRVALLRDPVRRLVSVFNYGVLVHPERFAGATFDELVAAGEARRHSQARALLRAAGRDADALDGLALFRAAERELASAYALVGVTELFEETIFALCRLAGWTTIGMWWSVLAAPRTVDADRLSAATRRRLVADYAVDLDLYEAVRARFQADVAAAGRDATLDGYRAAARRRRELPAAAKATECLRWRQVLADHDRRPVGTAVRDVLRGARRAAGRGA